MPSCSTGREGLASPMIPRFSLHTVASSGCYINALHSDAIGAKATASYPLNDMSHRTRGLYPAQMSTTKHSLRLLVDLSLRL